VEGIYQNNIYSSQQQSPYVLPPSHSDHAYSHYGNQYRSSAFSDARSNTPTSSFHHSAGLNATSNTNTTTTTTAAATNNNNAYHHHHHHHHNQHHNHQDNTITDTFNNSNTNNTSTVGSWNHPSPTNLSWNTSPPPPLPPPSRHNSFSGYPSNSLLNNNSQLPHMATPMQRPKLTTTVWEDEGTLCYQVDAKSVCVARRQGM
jgi:hypothetical protein